MRRSRHKRMLKLTSGFIGRRSTCFRIAKQAYIKACLYARRDRKKLHAVRKRTNISALNFYLRCNFNVNYKVFITALRGHNVVVSVAVLRYLACVLRYTRLFDMMISEFIKGC
ncbi:50S ribosomal protein L20 [Candidatus Vidania fulgoroideorum]